ncbi:DNA helicase/exodeoxyribonuclease V subunit A [Mesorhizobium sp. J18]|uniref:double-strand break repair helicase AddA n=1 Tax=Mesorhizobium sp. J18 TaxID=935263 RepID=UPI00119B6EB1|nr:double-strand break repair helicase AddA [Mesorhizobium sp. J18]TWG88949.1 DNA helicase/exodeoxyribonuclease V subunit A [Mesorhizobium sp. J18]
MSQRPDIPVETRESQGIASDPRNSAWVSANAGSGKTHVLSQRVIRLLLEGTDPSKILCLTYTRAAAANMANRVFGNLAEWSRLSDAELSQKIAELEGKLPDRRKLRRARQLFARALETPGGLKIQTIHAFCEAILHQFPLEANIVGHFELLDPQMEAALLAEARRDLLTGIVAEADGEIAAAFAEVLERGGEKGLDDLLTEMLARRDGLRAFIDQIGNDRVRFSALFEEFGFGEEENADSIAAAAWPLPGFSAEEFGDFVAAAQVCDARAVLKNIVPAAQQAFAESDPIRRLEFLQAAFLKADGAPYGSSTFKKSLCDRIPDLLDRYEKAAQTIVSACDRLALFRMLEATRAALIIADWLIARYEWLKRARGFLDFNDLIVRTIRLLARPDAGPWVQFKLDKGIDHILIDEAQDTSPDQWSVVKKLAEEFFAGLGGRDNVHRTIFAVGDEKQSIYSFQGAEPAAFADNGTEFSTKVPASGGTFQKVRLTRSFRSTGDVLSAVDLVFSREEVRRGLTRDPEPIDHKAIRAGAPGYVELWMSLSPQVVQEPEDWTQAVDHASAPAVRLAETIAETIDGWLREGEMIEGQGRKLMAGDVMVLVRKRDRFVHALSRSLKNRNINVAGTDRLRLTDHIAVQDLLALGRFILQSHDDLSLAALLRSPIFDISEEKLFDLAWPRGRSVTLFEALRMAAGSDPSLAEIVEALEEWQNAAAFKPVFEFYAGVLAGTPEREGARRKLVARLGHEANDILDEFLSFCLATERAGLSGLEAFLATLDGAAPEIKREMDQTRNEVRIMTVHAAKGLEAPVVFLVDPGSAPISNQHLPKLIAFEPKGGGWTGKGYLWRAGKDVSNTSSRMLEAEARQKAEEEYRRLLYVGMTRAEDRLIICGYTGVRGSSALTWHRIVHDALSSADNIETRAVPEACAPVYRYRVTPLRPIEPEKEKENRVIKPATFPPDFTKPVPAPPALPRPLAPSGATALIEPGYEAAVSLRSPVLDGEEMPRFAVERGHAIHRLLQILPEIAPDQREAAAWRYLSRAGASWSLEERQTAWQSVATIMENERFAPIFAPGSRPEISIMGTLKLGSRMHAVSGKIDRLAVSGDEVLIVDYKTNRPAPADLPDVPSAYVTQLALYAELLKPLYPEKAIAAALLFTEVPRLIQIPPQYMEDALARLTG